MRTSDRQDVHRPTQRIPLIVQPPSLPSGSDAGAGPTILLVEDNAAQVQMTQRALRECGRPIELVVVGDGREAIDYLLGPEHRADQVHHNPDLILLDLNLPQMSGREVLERIRATPACRHLPVIVFSSSCAPPEVRGLYAAGANGYVEKPQDYPRFVEVMRNLLGFWLDTACLPRGGE
jgi:CheY-like chemotaxis protein